MANTKTKGCSCLICASNISTNKITQADKGDTLFIVHILLNIPQESQLVDNSIDWIKSIQICEYCAIEIQQCKKIYIEICDKIEGFWETQSKILKKFSKDQKTSKHRKDICDDDWVFQCRNFVKDCSFTGSGYPFVVQDLETLPISTSSLPLHTLQDEVNCAVKQDINDNTTKPEIDDSQLSEQNESLFIKQELNSDHELADIEEDQEYQLDEDDNISSDNESDYEPSPSKKPKISTTKRKSTRKSGTQIKRGPRPKISNIYPDFKRDPNTKKFHCTWSEDCSQQFADKYYLQYHWDRHTGTPRQQCDECSQAFYSRNMLVCHKQREHPKEDDKFDCEKCGKNFKTRENLLGHLRTHHDQKKEEERLEKLKKMEKDPIKKDPVTNKWICYWPDCDKSYLDRHDLTFHLDRHKGTPNQKCEVCGELFYSKCQLNRHIEKMHEKDEKFECEICGDKFKVRSDLHQHRAYRHSESGIGIQVVCQICGKAIKKGGLNAHVRNVHGGVEERKFACHLCPGKFQDLRGLKRHMWRMHEICEDEELKEKLLREREKERARGFNWRCHVKGCRRRFGTEGGLKKHVDGVHKGNWDGDEDTNWKFSCEICGKGFHERQKFTRHAKQHDKG